MKIGDRVWTQKRGWGVVKSHNKENTGHRPFSIAFDEDFEGYSVVLRNPKLQNVFSEAQKKALDELAQEKGVEQFWKTLNDSIDATFEAIRKQLSPSIFEPKFKAGDMVEHTSGWVRKVSGYYYDLLNGGFQYRFDSLRGVSIRESELKSWVKHGLATEDPVRPWVPTRITHSHKMEEIPHGGFLCEHIEGAKFSYAGKHISGKDIIFEHDPMGIEIWYGINGDDI